MFLRNDVANYIRLFANSALIDCVTPERGRDCYVAGVKYILDGNHLMYYYKWAAIQQAQQHGIYNLNVGTDSVDLTSFEFDVYEEKTQEMIDFILGLY
jgi:hypothetical protein